MYVVDVSDPTLPVFVAHAFTPGRARGLVLDGTWAYVADDAAGLVVYDVSDPLAPTQVATLPAGAGAYVLAVSSGIAYVSASPTGILVADVSDPRNPSALSTIPTTGVVQALFLDGATLYLDIGGGVVQAYDVRDPEHPLLLGSLVGSPRVAGAAVYGHYAFLAEDIYGLRMAAAHCDAQSAVEGPPVLSRHAVPEVFPNPSDRGTTIRFDLSVSGPARLSIFDASGREVRRLLDDVLRTGPASIRWDRRSDQGALVPNGIYFVRLEHEGQVDTGKMIVIDGMRR
jgi:hypothetical protein